MLSPAEKKMHKTQLTILNYFVVFSNTFKFSEKNYVNVTFHNLALQYFVYGELFFSF